MSIARTIQNQVNSIPPGRVFGYAELSGYTQSPTAVVKTVSRLVAENKLVRLGKGRFYLPKKGLLGVRKPSDGELVRSVLYKNGQLCGYVTGLALYNRLGLTTQLPRTITVAYNGGRQEKDFGTIRIRTVTSRALIKEPDVKLLQYLDVLRGIKKIPDSDINVSLKLMRRYISELENKELARFIELAENYYGAQVRALLCLLLSDLGKDVPESLSGFLNPTTTYKLNLDSNIWPGARKWNIK